MTKHLLKKIASVAIGIPAGVVACSECNELQYWWVSFVGLGILVMILAWNGIFKWNGAANEN